MISRLPFRLIGRFQSTLAATAVQARSVPNLKPTPTPIQKLNAIEDKQLPRSVEAVYHKPLKHPVKYGDLVADLQLRSYTTESMDFFADFIIRVGYYLGMPMTGPKPMPTRRERWTVIKSPFAQAKTKENFERHTHKRLIRVWDTNPEVVEIWLSYITKHSIPGVGLKCNIFQREGIELEELPKDIKLPSTEDAQTLDEVVGAKVVELLSDPEFKKHL
ncbi:HGR034Cp [Eremothecium sinecaudum]|uniref:Small ribosomal subunit protein uS10m n=1 Tax=Eremothecium sinecaudum TaxID=45286 RepID=A0A0X8HVV9_9SACH|nr:HGR034Cp [Eremothecium sinecaudum]AMD22373.1 HGR034Cp [Eremothecium sinecaudum]